MIPPIKIRWEITGGENRGLMGRRQIRATEAKVLAAELRRGQIRELGDAMDSSGVKPLMPSRTAEISLENGEPMSMLLLISIALAKPLDEAGEVSFSVEEVFSDAGYDLLDKGIFKVSSRGGGDEEEEEEREKAKIHGVNGLGFQGLEWNPKLWIWNSPTGYMVLNNGRDGGVGPLDE